MGAVVEGCNKMGRRLKVRELWKSVCATGVRPSGKNVPGKKRAPRHHLVASHFAVSHFLRFVNPAADGLFIFFCCWRGMAGQAQVLPCSPATCFSHGWWGEADSAFDKGKWAEGYLGIPRVSTAQTDMNLVRSTLTDSHKHCINQITSDFVHFCGEGVTAISSTLVLPSSSCTLAGVGCKLRRATSGSRGDHLRVAAQRQNYSRPQRLAAIL